MVLRWFAAGYLETEKHFRRIMGCDHLWVLKAKLQELHELRMERLQSTSTVSVDNTAIDRSGNVWYAVPQESHR